VCVNNAAVFFLCLLECTFLFALLYTLYLSTLSVCIILYFMIDSPYCNRSLLDCYDGCFIHKLGQREKAWCFSFFSLDLLLVATIIVLTVSNLASQPNPRYPTHSN
jgi:hypothetical protein